MEPAHRREYRHPKRHCTRFRGSSILPSRKLEIMTLNDPTLSMHTTVSYQTTPFYDSGGQVLLTFSHFAWLFHVDYLRAYGLWLWLSVMPAIHDYGVISRRKWCSSCLFSRYWPSCCMTKYIYVPFSHRIFPFRVHSRRNLLSRVVGHALVTSRHPCYTKAKMSNIIYCQYDLFKGLLIPSSLLIIMFFSQHEIMKAWEISP